jgi:hypothetical protein
MKVEHQMYDYTGNIWSHPNSNKMFKENLEVIPRKHSIDSGQTTAVFRTTHVMQGGEQSENSNVYSDRRVMRKREAYLWRNLLLIG